MLVMSYCFQTITYLIIAAIWFGNAFLVFIVYGHYNNAKLKLMLHLESDEHKNSGAKGQFIVNGM
jgi:hypothetical protein